jgi:hypothetical protein
MCALPDGVQLRTGLCLLRMQHRCCNSNSTDGCSSQLVLQHWQLLSFGARAAGLATPAAGMLIDIDDVALADQ